MPMLSRAAVLSYFLTVSQKQVLFFCHKEKHIQYIELILWIGIYVYVYSNQLNSTFIPDIDFLKLQVLNSDVV